MNLSFDKNEVNLLMDALKDKEEYKALFARIKIIYDAQVRKEASTKGYKPWLSKKIKSKFSIGRNFTRK